MQSLYHKDKKRRLLYNNFEQKKIIYKAIITNLHLKTDIRAGAFKKYNKLPHNSSLTRIHNRCVITNRPRAIYQKFRFSRLIFRKLALQGEIPGIIKATW